MNFVNLVPGDKVCEIRIESKNPAGDGLKSASYTGWFLFPVGPCALSLKVEGLEEVKGSLNIEEGAGLLYAIYLEPDPKPAKDDKPAPPLLKIRSFPAFEAEGRALRFASVCAEDNRFQLGPQAVDVERFQVMEIPTWSGAGFPLKKNGKAVRKIPSVQEQEPYYLLAGSDLEGNCTAALVFAGKPGIPPWRQKKKEETAEKKP